MWIKDPKTNASSVSLTLMIVSFVIAMGVSLAQVFKQTESGGMSLEIFVTCTSLYFGRRFNFKSKSGIQIDQGADQGDNK